MVSRVDRYLEKNNNKKSRRLKTAFAIVIVALFASSVSLIKIINKSNGAVVEDSDAGKLSADKLAMKINAYPHFKNGLSNGNLLIENKLDNRYNIIVKIYLEKNNELVYKSPKLEPGQKIEQDKLIKNLKVGSYRSIAYFNAYDKNGNNVGRSAVEIAIVIDN